MLVLGIAHSAPGAERGRRLLADRPDVTLVHAGRGAGGILRAVATVLRARPRVAYLVDVGASTTAAALAARLAGARVVVDTGDLVFALERSRGTRSFLGLLVVGAGERLALACAHHVVVRGREHLDRVRGPATFAPDLPPEGAAPVDGDPARRELGLDEAFVVGLVGSLNRAPRRGISYGWDVIEALAHTQPEVVALIVGDGEARPDLEKRARELGVQERCRFAGFREEALLPRLIGTMDVAVSTQTNDAVGAVRTTGKLPLYLACGCPVLASDVGEARRLLGPLGWTIRYDGVVDRAYPGRLAARIGEWAADRDGAPRRREQALAIAREAFDADAVRARVGRVVDDLLAG
jgi:glycosyltransferase involved in cell wall biosynthesis